ncbi:MAG: class B sortase [Erysipelotrichaceae bacterium]|nr:class B sortase [Erysipelotrichaceae bacterium]
MKKRTVTYLFVIAIILILIFMAYIALQMVKGTQEYDAGNEVYDEIRTIAQNEDNGETAIDFVALQEINDDIVGWLILPDTIIDYPVVKGEDNDYYLHHLFDKTYNFLGTLFVDFRNSDPFEDRITAIYGHAMLNGSMFAVLEQYKKQDFYEGHRQFIYESKDKSYVFEPFAGKVMDAATPFLQFNFTDDQEFLDYVNEYIEHSTFRSDVSISKDDKIVMMIKCSKDFETARYVLLCKVTETQR